MQETRGRQENTGPGAIDTPWYSTWWGILFLALLVFFYTAAAQGNYSTLVGYAIGLAIAGLVSNWIFRDGRRRGLAHSTAQIWAFLGFLFLIVVLPIYLIVRPKKPLQKTRS